MGPGSLAYIISAVFRVDRRLVLLSDSLYRVTRGKKSTSGIVFSRMVRILNLLDFWRIYPSNVIFEGSEGFLFEVSTWMGDMPPDVTVKEPSKRSLGVVSRNHRKESSNSADEHEATEYFNKTATSDSSTSTIVAGLTEQSSILLFFLPILMIRKQVAGN